MTERRRRLLLIDGHALAFRAFHALKDQGLRASSGEPTYAVFGFISIMLNNIAEHRPDYLAVSFDIGRTFRDDMYAEYKAGRVETPAEFEPQLARIKQLLAAFNIPIYTADGFEADDVIGTIGRQAAAADTETIILTGDTDTLQLVDDFVRVALANPYLRGDRNTSLYGLAEVTERYKGLRPDQLADLRGLKGDTSDNIPGVKGIGEAGAIALLNQFGSVEGLYENFADVPNRYKKPLDGQREVALFSKRLATIVCDVPVTLDLPSAVIHDYDRANVIALFQELEIGSSLIKRLPTPPSAPEVVAIPQPAPRQDGQIDMFAEPVALPAPAASGPQQISMFGEALPAPPGAPGAPSPGGAQYDVVLDAAALAAMVAAMADAPLFAFDTETLGLRPLQDEMVGLSVAVRPGHAWYVPLRHSGVAQLPVETVLDAVRPLFGDAQRPKIAHNAKFDIEVLERAGVKVEGLSFDTMIAAKLLDKRPGLKDLAFYELRLAEVPTPIEELIGKGKTQISFADVPLDRAAPYAAADADYTLRLKPLLEAALETMPAVASVFRDLEMPVVAALTRIEQAGIAVDEAYLRELGRRMGEQIAALEAEIHAVAERPFNINSADQLADVLFIKVGLPAEGLEKTKTGRYSLTAEVLEKLREKDSSGIIERIMRHRSLSKLKSTYLDELPNLINPETGRVHTTYSQIGAATGRLSSNNPNLQNIPTRTDEGREIRRGFVAAPGHTFVACDYSQIELRVLAHMTQDPALMQAFLEDQDIHAATASRLFGVEPDAVSKNQRRIAKMSVFGIIYGISSFGLAQRLAMGRGEAQSMIDGIFAAYPGLRQYIEQTLEFGRREGYVQSMFGRRRRMPELTERGPRRQAAEREAINAPIQATAADIMKMAMVRVDTAIRERQSLARVLLQVHDELILEAPHDAVQATVELVCAAMEGAYQLRVPLKVESETGPNWEELKPA